MSASTSIALPAVPAITDAARQRAVEALGVLDTAASERFDRITRLTSRALGVQAVRVQFVDADRVWAKSKTDDGPDETPRALAICDTTVRDAVPLVVPDLSLDARFADNPLVVAGGVRFYAGFPVLAPTGEPVGVVCAFDTVPREVATDELDLLGDMARWVQDELRVLQEASRAGRMQQGLLPRRLDGLEGYDLAGGTMPVHALGGDFYDWYPVRDGVAFTLADVMGKGAPAALVAATVRGVMRAGSRVDGPAPAVEAAAVALDSELADAEAFVTLFHAHLHEATGVVRYLDAGHGLTVVVRADGTSERLLATTMPLGTTWDEMWQEASLALRPGDTLVSVSDGVLDALDGTLDSLDEVAALTRESASAQALVTAVLDRVRSTAADDVTVLVLRRDAGLQIA